MLTVGAEAVDLMPDETAGDTAEERLDPEPELADAGAGSRSDLGPDPSVADGDSRSDPPGPDGAGAAEPSAIDSLIGAFLEAGPEATEHLIRAAHELVLAAQAVVDAAQRAIREQQDVRSARHDDAETATVHDLDATE